MRFSGALSVWFLVASIMTISNWLCSCIRDSTVICVVLDRRAAALIRNDATETGSVPDRISCTRRFKSGDILLPSGVSCESLGST